MEIKTMYRYKVVPNESTGGLMAVFASLGGEFVGIGFDDSVVELPNN